VLPSAAVWVDLHGATDDAGTHTVTHLHAHAVPHGWLLDSLPWLLDTIGASGMLGATMALSLTADLLALLSVHIWIAYSVAAALYHWQLNALISLFHLFRGARPGPQSTNLPKRVTDTDARRYPHGESELLFFFWCTLHGQIDGGAWSLSHAHLARRRPSDCGCATAARGERTPGKKRNVLRHRIDDCDYDQDQLLLGTVLFTVLLFLLPTTAAYYILFSMVCVQPRGRHRARAALRSEATAAAELGCMWGVWGRSALSCACR
jgi:hypothetical protein